MAQGFLYKGSMGNNKTVKKTDLNYFALFHHILVHSHKQNRDAAFHFRSIAAIAMPRASNYLGPGGQPARHSCPFTGWNKKKQILPLERSFDLRVIRQILEKSEQRKVAQPVSKSRRDQRWRFQQQPHKLPRT